MNSVTARSGEARCLFFLARICNFFHTGVFTSIKHAPMRIGCHFQNLKKAPNKDGKEDVMKPFRLHLTRFTLIFLSLLILSMGLTACGGGSSSETSGDSSKETGDVAISQILSADRRCHYRIFLC